MSEYERLDRLENIADKMLEGLQETRYRVDSNSKAIEALTNFASDIQHQTLSMQREMVNFQRDMLNFQRDMLTIQRKIDDNTADIRELMIENQRILKYLEKIVND